MNIEVKQVSRRFGETQALHDVNLAVGNEVNVLAMIGPSGGGKSTILDAIAGFAQSTGALRLDGRDLAPLAPVDRPVSMIFQDHNLFPHLSAAENVALALSPNLTLSAADGARVDATLAEVGLEGFEDRRPANLSGGQRQRVALARALLRDRPVLLLCRSGQRSRFAAEALTALGYETCFNVADGFEGPPDDRHHRGATAGWKASGLPWIQG